MSALIKIKTEKQQRKDQIYLVKSAKIPTTNQFTSVLIIHAMTGWTTMDITTWKN